MYGIMFLFYLKIYIIEKWSFSENISDLLLVSIGLLIM